MTEGVGLTKKYVADSEQDLARVKERFALVLAVSFTAAGIVAVLYEPGAQIVQILAQKVYPWFSF